ncbi:MAG: zf-HC2 domain-containing protein, partial [Actinomycetales bacterium]
MSDLHHLLGAYVLGALDELDRARFRSHLQE